MEITLLDGAIGQELVNRSGDRPTESWSTSVMLEKPRLLDQVHAEYFSVGASVATTNTYALLFDQLKRVGLQGQIDELWSVAIKAAKDARDNHGSGRVAGSIGPLMASYRPDICPPAREAAKQYADIVAALSPMVDVLLIETMSSVDQAEGALIAACTSIKPVWLSVTVDDDDGTRLRSGELVSDLKPMMSRYQVDAVLVNCSRPEAIGDGLEVLKSTGLPIGAYGNGFTRISDDYLQDNPTVSALERRIDLSPADYAGFAMSWIGQGATILGGCCEVGPTHIAELARMIIKDGHVIV